MSRSFVLVGALALLVAAPLAAGPDAWTALGPEGGSIVRLVASPARPGTVWAVSPLRRIFKTTDGATTWKPVPSLQTRGVVDIIPDPSNASLVYAWSSREGYLKSTDGGKSWSAAFDGFQTPPYSLTIAPSRSPLPGRALSMRSVRTRFSGARTVGAIGRPSPSCAFRGT